MPSACCTGEGIGFAIARRSSPIRNLYLLAFLGISLAVVPGMAKENNCSLFPYADVFPCHVDTLSWVEVSITGALLQDRREQFEELIRSQITEHIPWIKNETRRPGDILRENDWDAWRPEVKRRGMASCAIWTVGADYPVAMLLECELIGLGMYGIPSGKRFQSRFLGYASADMAKDAIEKAIQDAIAQVTGELLRVRERVLEGR